MTINSTTRKTNPLVGNGNTATYPFAFKVFQDSEIVVKKLEISTNIETTLTLGASNDYIVTLNSDQNSNPGGSITLRSGGNNQNLATGFQIVITSSLTALQGTDLTNQGGFYPEVINDALDKSVILHQQQEDEIDRSIKFSLTNSINSTEITESATARANKVLAFDNTGEIGLSDAAPKAFLIGATAPTNAPDGSIWYDTVSGRTFVYYVDADSSQWVEANPSFEVGDLTNTNLSNLTDSNIANNADIDGSKLKNDSVPLGKLLDGALPTDITVNSSNIVNNSIIDDDVNSSAAIDSSKLSFTQTNSTTSRTVSSKFADFVSAKDFGAVGDGSNDDTAEIQAAINTGKPVYLPKGTYKITDTLILNQGYRALIGDECMPVIEMHTENKSAIAITEPPSSQDGNKGLNEYSRIENLYIQRKVGGSYNIPNYVAVIQEYNAGVVVSGDGSGRAAAVQYTRISNVRVGNFPVGFYFADCVGVTVHKCFTQNLLNYGIRYATYGRSGNTITVSNRNDSVTDPVAVHNIRVGDKVKFTATSGGAATMNDAEVTGVTSTTFTFSQTGSDIADTSTCIYSLVNYRTINPNGQDTFTDITNNMWGVGFYFDATRFAAGEISPLASIELVECDDGRLGDAEGVQSVSYLIAGTGDIRDIFFQRCESSHADYGWRINGSNAAPVDLNWDVHIIRPIVDAFKIHGIFIENVNGVGALTINGGYFVGRGNYLIPDGTYANANACIQANNSNGIVVTGGTQILGIGNNASTETDDGVRFDNCNECIVSGNRFSNLQFAISLNGTSYSTIQGNVIGAHYTETENTPTLLMAIRLFGNSTRNTIMGNIIKGKDTSGAGQYNQGIKISANGDNENIIVGNAFHPTTVATKILDSGVGTLKDNNITN